MDDLSSNLASLKIDRSPPRERGAPMSRLAAGLVGLGLLGGLTAWAYPKVEAGLRETEVQTATITQTSPLVAATSLTAAGYVVTNRRSKVGSSASGRITKLHVRVGSRVEEGDLLLELESADQKSGVEAAAARRLAAWARVESARARVRELHVQLARQRVLFAVRAAPRAVIEDLDARIATEQAQLQSFRAEARAADAEVERARVTLAHMRVTAPLRGTVLDDPLDVGQTVSPQTELMEIADLTTQRVEIDVPESRLALVEVGGPCDIALDALSGRRLRGEVLEIGRRVNRSKATIPVRVAFADDTSEVLPDMAARVSLLKQRLDASEAGAASKRIVPAQAVSERNGTKVVFVVEGGAVRLTPVALGPRAGDGFELIEGPSAGSRVVTRPAHDLASGQRIKERTE